MRAQPRAVRLKTKMKLTEKATVKLTEGLTQISDDLTYLAENIGGDTLAEKVRGETLLPISTSYTQVLEKLNEQITALSNL